MNIVDSLCTTKTEEDKEIRYIYRVTKEYFNESQAYGIEVERLDLKCGRVVNIERDGIRLISNNRFKVSELMRMLHKHQVSPIHLVDILGEYVDEYIYDFDELEDQRVIN
ncbi:DUF6514 family protein [Clostridium sp.]|uniref:DUF6514 family protein n=1 Tax=Clostridium sp. TaxID=1506 RepID=UPI003F2F9728